MGNPLIRVLFVEASSGGVVGGSLTGLYHLVRGLDRDRFRVDMVLYEPKAIEDDLREAGVIVHHVSRRRLPKEHALQGASAYDAVRQVGAVRAAMRAGRQTLRLLFEELPVTRQLRAVIRRTDPDVVHLGNGVRANFDAILACLSMRVPIVCHVKGFEKYGARERRAARRVDVLLCMTGAILEHCRSRGVQGRRSCVVYDGVDEAWITPARPAAALREELGLAADDFCIGVVGNIQEWKGQAVLVEAMAEVLRRVPNARAVVIGGVHRAGEAYAARVRERAGRADVDGRVVFTGFRSDVVDVMNAMDVIAHTSVRPEPFGRVILEGMLLGKPVIATRGGGVSELIEEGESGFFVPPADVTALARRLVEIREDPDRARRIGQQARARARERFALSKQVKEMSEIYERLAEGRDA